MREWLESLAAWAKEQGLSLLEALDVAESEGHIDSEEKSWLQRVVSTIDREIDLSPSRVPTPESFAEGERMPESGAGWVSELLGIPADVGAGLLNIPGYLLEKGHELWTGEDEEPLYRFTDPVGGREWMKGIFGGQRGSRFNEPTGADLRYSADRRGPMPSVNTGGAIADKVEVSLDEESYLNQAMLAALGQAMHGKTGTPAPVSLGGPSAGWEDPFSAGSGGAKDYTYIGGLS